MTENMSWRERAAKLIEEAMWSPASGPVVWTAERKAAMLAQAGFLADAIAALGPPQGQDDGWRPIESRNSDKECLLAAAPGGSRRYWRYAVGSRSLFLGRPLLCDWPYGFPPTHWHPLPAEPMAAEHSPATSEQGPTLDGAETINPPPHQDGGDHG